MPNVTFDEEGYTKRPQSSSDRTTAVGRIFIKLSGGKIKNQQQANVAILVVTVIVFALTIYSIFS